MWPVIFPHLCVERKRCSARVSSARARRRKSWSRRFPKSGDVHRKSEGMVNSQYQWISKEPANIKSPLTFECFDFLWVLVLGTLLVFAFQSLVNTKSTTSAGRQSLQRLQVDKPIGFAGPQYWCPYFPESIYHQ